MAAGVCERAILRLPLMLDHVQKTGSRARRCHDIGETCYLRGQCGVRPDGKNPDSRIQTFKRGHRVGGGDDDRRGRSKSYAVERQVIDSQVRPIECFAVVRYALAARAAQHGNIDTPYATEAIDRLQAYGDERIAECITEARGRDPTLAAYTPGEFTRARRGQYVEVPVGVAPPPLAREDD